MQWEEDATAITSRHSDRLLLAVAKALTLAADVAGSALPKAGEGRRWIGEQLGRRADTGQLRQIVDVRLRGATLRPFQRAVGASTAPVTLASAGCGSGKTLAAYLWAAEQHPKRQLWVTYPTTGTATEGFRDYVDGADVVGRLEHGRAAIDLEIFGLTDGASGQREQDRLEALRIWGAEVVTCTVDTVLGLIQNQRKGLYAWPGLSESAIVFDEIHAYDHELFGALLRFIEALPGTPVLLMTASLPANRSDALKGLVRRVHGQELHEVAGPADLEALPRYRRARSEDPWLCAEECLADGGKVLWVSNTVNRCLALAKHPIAARFDALVYHSRFRYVDRVARHSALIDAFRDARPVLALTTQVAEMSLDLSADLLITDLAPVPALIQRLGRLNRRSSVERPDLVKPFVILDTDSPLPYTREQLGDAERWLQRLGRAPLSQRDLTEAWVPRPEPGEIATRSEWLDGRFVTAPAAVREGNIGITVLLDEDSRRVKAKELSAIEVAIPMNAPPRSVGSWRNWPVVDWYPVVPPGLISYDPVRGGRWQSE
jgi:CRISPR-associated endonuclease/helicase Cas3